MVKVLPKGFVLILMLLVCACAVEGFAQVADWPGVFAPTELWVLHLELENPADWDVIRKDKTFDIEVPAWFWADGEENSRLYVSVRRKSCDAMPDENDPFKISVKIDINEYVKGQKWHGLTKLSLENGDDADGFGDVCECAQANLDGAGIVGNADLAILKRPMGANDCPGRPEQ